MSITFLICIVLALGLLGGSGWLLLLARGQEREQEILQRLRTPAAVGEDTELPIARNRRLSNPLLRSATQLLWRAGIELPPARVVAGLLAILLIAVLVFALGGLLPGVLIVGGLLAVLYGVLLRLGSRRRARIVEQLPDFLETVIRVLSAGNSLEESFASAARENADPIRPLFLSVARQVKLGAPIDQVLVDVGTLYRLRDLRVMGLAASVNRRFGGSLRAVLKSVVVAVRQRSLSARELRALTAETRFSAVVLAIVPISLSIFIYSRNTQYYATMYQDPTGKILLIASVVMQVVGAFVLWRMLGSTEDAES